MHTLRSFTLLVEREYQKILFQASQTFNEEMKNLVIRTLWNSEKNNLYGQYYGVPTTHWAPHDSGRLPPEIIIFARPLIDDYPDPKKLQQKIHKVLLHEIGHHLGMSEDELRKKGIY